MSKTKLPDMNQFRVGPDESVDLSKVDQAKRDLWDQMKVVLRTAEREGRELLASEARSYEAAERVIDELGEIITARSVDRSTLVGIGAGEWVDHRGNRTPMDGVPGTGGSYRDGTPLTDRQSFAGFVRARGLVREDEEELSLQKVLRGSLFGEWQGAERRAMSGLSAANGAVMLPAPIAAAIVDLARAESRVLQAGARLVPMANRTLDVPRWVKDPEPQWRVEGDPIAEDDATMDKAS
jgi:HK97 family phage major capsid protein